MENTRARLGPGIVRYRVYTSHRENNLHLAENSPVTFRRRFLAETHLQGDFLAADYRAESWAVRSAHAKRRTTFDDNS